MNSAKGARFPAKMLRNMEVFEHNDATTGKGKAYSMVQFEPFQPDWFQLVGSLLAYEMLCTARCWVLHCDHSVPVSVSFCLWALVPLPLTNMQLCPHGASFICSGRGRVRRLKTAQASCALSSLVQSFGSGFWCRSSQSFQSKRVKLVPCRRWMGFSTIQS